MQITAAEIKRLAPPAVPRIVNGIVSYQEMLADHGITTPLRLCHLMAQLAHESAHFKVTREYADGSDYEGRKDLGNTKKGDGKRYRGRGLIQITGRANSRAAGKALGYDYEASPELMEEFPHALLVSLWYWNSRKLNTYADRDDILTITKKINGGTNGLADRKKYLAKAKAIWGTGKAVDAVRLPRPKPVRPKPTEPVQRALDQDGVKEVQQSLRDLGFPEVGNVDGKIGLAGSRTRGAISSYRAARGLTLSEEIDDELLADIEDAKATGWKRQVSVERATATKEDLPDSAVLQNTDRAKRHIGLGEKIMLWFGIGAPAAGGAQKFLNPDRIDERLGLLQRLGAFAAENWWIALVLVGVGVSVYYMRSASKRVDAAEEEEVQGYREGRHV